MKITEVADEMRRLYEAEAENYDLGHAIAVPPKTLDLYGEEIANDLGVAGTQKALDVGMGTGFLTGILLKSGYKVWGVDTSQRMVDVARAKYTSASFAKGDVEQDDIYEDGFFDLIISRQVVCHFLDPLSVFKRWYRWLGSGGRVAVIEVFWRRSDWTGSWSKFVDYLPLACTETWASVSYLLQKAGFSIKAARLLDRVNEDEKQRSLSATWKPKTRYIVVAQKT